MLCSSLPATPPLNHHDGELADMARRRPVERPDDLAPNIELEGSAVCVATCSWTDRALLTETDWYPRRSMPAAERLAYYASQFPVVEADSTYFFPPTPELSEQW